MGKGDEPQAPDRHCGQSPRDAVDASRRGSSGTAGQAPIRAVLHSPRATSRRGGCRTLRPDRCRGRYPPWAVSSRDELPTGSNLASIPGPVAEVADLGAADAPSLPQWVEDPSGPDGQASRHDRSVPGRLLQKALLPTGGRFFSWRRPGQTLHRAGARWPTSSVEMERPRGAGGWQVPSAPGKLISISTSLAMGGVDSAKAAPPCTPCMAGFFHAPGSGRISRGRGADGRGASR